METTVTRLLLTTWIVAQVRGQDVTMSTIMDDIFANYDRKLPPRYNYEPGNRQVEVSVTVFINSMYSISESDMDYKMSMFLRERWVDERLQFNDTLNLTRLELHVSSHDLVWIPDMFILNEKFSDFHEVTVPNRLVHIYPNGTVQLSMRVTGVFVCRMKLQKYPFDIQSCKLEVESYGYSTQKIRFVWPENAITMADDIEFPQFTLIDSKSYECEKEYYGIMFPCVGMKFVLKRNYAYFMLQIYVPSVLIVVLSWVNFWLDCTSVPARISLGLLTVLTMTTQSAGARANLPKVSYVKAIDVYMAVCLTFVFLGLLEFAYVNVLSRKDAKRATDRDKGTKNGFALPPVKDKRQGFANKEEECRTNVSVKSKKWRFNYFSVDGRARLVDRVSRILFPATFALFNVVYWVFYFVWNPQFEADIMS